MAAVRRARGIVTGGKPPKSCVTEKHPEASMIYLFAAMLPPLGLLLNGQPLPRFSICS
jgi:hypothetical protein